MSSLQKSPIHELLFTKIVTLDPSEENAKPREWIVDKSEPVLLMQIGSKLRPISGPRQTTMEIVPQVERPNFSARWIGVLHHHILTVDHDGGVRWIQGLAPVFVRKDSIVSAQLGKNLAIIDSLGGIDFCLKVLSIDAELRTRKAFTYTYS